MEIKSLLLAVAISSSFISLDTLAIEHQSNTNDVVMGGNLPPSTDEVKYLCQTANSPQGWVLTGRGGFDCYLAGSGSFASFKFEKPAHNQKICSNGPMPPAKYYVAESENAHTACGVGSSVGYTLLTIKNSNKSGWGYGDTVVGGIEVCDFRELPSSYLHVGASIENVPYSDYVITRRNIGKCQQGVFSSKTKNYAKGLKGSSMWGPHINIPETITVCTEQTLPPYLEIIEGSLAREPQCDFTDVGTSGESIKVILDLNKACTSPYLETSAKYLCGFGDYSVDNIFMNGPD